METHVRWPNHVKIFWTFLNFGFPSLNIEKDWRARLVTIVKFSWQLFGHPEMKLCSIYDGYPKSFPVSWDPRFAQWKLPSENTSKSWDAMNNVLNILTRMKSRQFDNCIKLDDCQQKFNEKNFLSSNKFFYLFL